MIRTQCSICRLAPQRLTAVNEALSDGNISFSEVARNTGLSKSSLSRHWHHLTESTRALAHSEDLREKGLVVPTKQELLARLEMLWAEATEGLQAAKQPIVLKRADGSQIEVNAGDLRARSNFLREARETLEMEGNWSGHFPTGQNVWGGGIVIVLPGHPSTASDPANDGTVDIALPRHR